MEFKDRGLLETAFVHRSFLNEKEGRGMESNERLEFLGDSVLSTVISHVLYQRSPEVSEGELTNLRAKLVNGRTLARIARGLDMGLCLMLGKGERASGGADNTTILAGAFEAVVAAVYLEGGFDKAFSFIEGLYSPLIEKLLKEPGHFNFKPRLQVLAQKLFKKAPVYRVVSESGPDHKKIFEVEVMVDGRVYGRGSESTKKDAEQAAAGEALKELVKIQKEGAAKGA